MVHVSPSLQVRAGSPGGRRSASDQQPRGGGRSSSGQLGVQQAADSAPADHQQTDLSLQGRACGLGGHRSVRDTTGHWETFLILVDIIYVYGEPEECVDKIGSSSSMDDWMARQTRQQMDGLWFNGRYRLSLFFFFFLRYVISSRLIVIILLHRY